MRRIFMFLVVSLMLTGCGKNPQSQASQSLQLHEGEKWKVNAEMSPYIEEAERILEDYLSNGKTDYRSLASELEKQNAGLIKSCTMKGDGHDELHNWLHPHMELVERLKNAENEQMAGEVTRQIKQSFEEYHKYFE